MIIQNLVCIGFVCTLTVRTLVGTLIVMECLHLKPDHINRLRRNCKRFRWNTIQLQSVSSDVCGQFCIMFLDYMSSGLGFEKFLENFSADLVKNDDVARNYVQYRNAEVGFSGNGCCNVRCLQNCCGKMSLI
jgi:hypothetical protein